MAGRPQQAPARPLDRAQLDQPKKGEHVDKEVNGDQWPSVTTFLFII
jgi:hypothetical protein